MHGLKYSRLVENGDTSVYKKLCTEKPYGNEIAIDKSGMQKSTFEKFLHKVARFGCYRTISSKMVSKK